MRVGAVVALVVGLAVAAQGAPPVQLEVRQFGQMVFVLAKTDGQKVKFAPLDEGLERIPPEFVPQTDKTAVFYAEHGGEYRILAYSAVGGDPTDPAIQTVVVKGPTPEPPPVPPGPGPKPEPAPTPGSKTFWVVVVEDEDGPNVEEAKLLNDDAYWAALRERGHSFRQYRPGSPAAQAGGYVALAEKVGLPAVILLEREPGKAPAAVEKLPADAAALDALIRRAGGK